MLSFILLEPVAIFFAVENWWKLSMSSCCMQSLKEVCIHPTWTGQQPRTWRLVVFNGPNDFSTFDYQLPPLFMHVTFNPDVFNLASTTEEGCADAPNPPKRQVCTHLLLQILWAGKYVPTNFLGGFGFWITSTVSVWVSTMHACDYPVPSAWMHMTGFCLAESLWAAEYSARIVEWLREDHCHMQCNAKQHCSSILLQDQDW
jgi:hypothetical protein